MRSPFDEVDAEQENVIRLQESIFGVRPALYPQQQEGPFNYEFKSGRDFRS